VLDVSANQQAITDEAQARNDGDSALTTRIDGISAQIVIPNMAGATGDYAGATTVYAGVWSESSARAEGDLALAVKTDTTAAMFQSATSNLTAAVQTETTARVTGDAALASQVTTVQANVDAAAVNTLALVQTEQTARSTGDSANATAITNVQASVADITNNKLPPINAAVQTNANAYADLSGKVGAAYTIKTSVSVNGHTYMSSIGVGTDNSSGIIESQILLAASRVAIIDANGGAITAPFVVQGGQVFISQALIGTSWITNANIVDVIQATAVGANGQPRWRLDKNGTLTMNGANAGAGYLTISDSTVQVYDGAGTLRVRLGLW
jgi:hypothetical protein